MYGRRAGVSDRCREGQRERTTVPFYKIRFAACPIRSRTPISGEPVGRRSIAAQKLGHQWIGIDITNLAISLIEKQLGEAFPGIKIDVHGTPKDLDGAYALAAKDKYQFQWWAVSLVKAVPYGGKKKGADTGIDGFIYFKPDANVTEKAIVSVKGGENINVSMVRDLAHVVKREKAQIGVMITLFEPTVRASQQSAALGCKSGW